LHRKHKEEIFSGSCAKMIPFKEYPIFTRYPEVVATYNASLRKKLLEEEDEIKRKEELLHQLKTKGEDLLG